MSKVVNNGEFPTKLKDDQFLRFADNSTMGILIIQRGYLKYFNKKFRDIFGYSAEEISNWKKREFYKIVHPEDLQKILKQFKIEDSKTVSVRFRGIIKQGKIINIENYICQIKYKNNTAFLSSYVVLNNSVENNNSSNKKIKIEIELPDKYEEYFKYFKTYFNISKKECIEIIIKKEIESRNDDLGIF